MNEAVQTSSTFTPRVFSGIQPSGGLTLGNYLGAMKRFVDMQEAGTHETVFCMVDLHAITLPQVDFSGTPAQPCSSRLVGKRDG